MIGSDLGLRDRVPVSNGDEVVALRTATALAHRLPRPHGRIGDLRGKAPHRVSAGRARRAGILVLEDLAVKALSRSGRRRGFCRAMGEVALGAHAR
ncbi:MAG: hypothetical protein ACP5P4_16095, partial [Steroidobacteraceae bacterium]